MVRIGAHIHEGDPLAAATARGAEVAQFFLGDPQGWGAPVIPGDPAGLRAAFAEAGVDVFIHSPYTINVASTNNRIRIPSRKMLAQQLEAATAIGAKGLIVHGGHITAGADPQAGLDNWRKAVERTECPIPLLIENTAGGANAMARTLESIARLWDVVADAGGEVGFCLDTCHAHAGGIELADAVDAVKAITGHIDLVHCNNSRDEFGSGRDRHDNLAKGTIDPDLIVGVVRAAGAPVVCETPNDDDGQAADIRWLRERLATA
jgi:deoxyribonuclease-4